VNIHFIGILNSWIVFSINYMKLNVQRKNMISQFSFTSCMYFPRELGRTSSMGGFSYLQLSQQQGARSAAAKPACHGHTDYVAEEFSTAGRYLLLW